MRVLSSEQMQRLDRFTIEEIGIPSLILMENAGHAVAATVRALVLEQDEREPVDVVVFCGPGNNGGDGFVVARDLLAAGMQPQVVVVGKEVKKLTGDIRKQVEVWQQLQQSITVVRHAKDLALLEQGIGDAEVIVVDALFGTGLDRPLEGVFATVVEWINANAAFIISVDLPSGLHSDDGRLLGTAVKADHTVTLAYPKWGLFVGHGPEQCGTLEVVDIGIPAIALQQLSDPTVELTEPQSVAAAMPPRSLQSHKGDHGHVLLLAGSPAKSGAAILAARAAMRSGAGLVTLATPASAHAIIKPALTEVMSLPLSEEGSDSGMLAAEAWDAIETALPGKQVIALGPGLIPSATLTQLILQIVQTVDLPVILDADGLNAIVAHSKALKQARAKLILTPHPGEMARLINSSAKEVQQHRLKVAQQFAREHDLYLVLKGFRSLIAFPDGRLMINPTGNPAMASAGVGDVLTGMLAAYIAQSGDVERALPAALFNHGRLGDQLAEEKGERGLIASDLIDAIPALHAKSYPHEESHTIFA